MGTITGSSVAEIDAPLDQVCAIVEDVLRAPEWQAGSRPCSRSTATTTAT
jgi:hypothetical protein